MKIRPIASHHTTAGGATLLDDASYPVLAIEFTSGFEFPTLWVATHDYDVRREANVFHPDLLRAQDCVVVDASIPPSWVCNIHHYESGFRFVIAPPALAARGFLESVTNGEIEACALLDSEVQLARR